MARKVEIFILCVVLAQVHSAPSGCTDLCGEARDFNTHTSESLSAFQTHAAMQQNAAFQNMHQALQNQLQGSQINLGYNRPGNWSEHNQWATDGGAGKVHEELGQIETGPAKVQYYKKNYTASFGSGGLNNVGIHQNNLLNSQNTADYANLQRYGHQSNTLNGQAARIEDLSGTQSNFGNEMQSRLHQLQSQMDQFTNSMHRYSLPITTTSTFETQMSQLQTRVDQVNNQIQQTSQIAQNSQSPSINHVYRQNERQDLQQLVQSYETRMRELQAMLERYSQQAQQRSQVSQNYNQHQNQYAENIAKRVVPVSNTQQHYEYKSHQEQHIKSQNGYIPTSQQNYPIPSGTLQTSESQRYQQETYVPNSQTTTHFNQQTASHPNNQKLIRVPIYRGNRYQNYRDVAEGQSGYQQTGQSHLGSESTQDIYNQNAGRYVAQPTVGKHVEEHWSASGHHSETVIPHQVVTGTVTDNQQSERIRQQQQYGGGTHSGYTSGGSSSSYHQGSASAYQQSGGQFRVGVLEPGQTADCDTSTQVDHGSYQRRYRRGIRDGFSQQTEDLTQQTEDLTQQTEDLTQQTEDLTQQTEDLTQQTEDLTQLTQSFGGFNQQQQQQPGKYQPGRHEHDHDHENRHPERQGQSDNFSQYDQQQTQRGQLEIGSQRHNEHNHGSQRTEGYGRHEHDHDHENRHSGRQQQTEDFSQYHQQQTQRGLEVESQHFNEHNHDSQRNEGHSYHDHDHYDRHQHDRNQQSHQQGGYTQQIEDLTKQAEGFGDFSHQQTGSVGYGQQTVQNQNQHSQQTQGLGSYAQHQSGNHGFGQQNQQHIGQEHYGSYSQNTEGYQQQQAHSLTQQTVEDLSQHSNNFGDFSQQSSLGNVEVGQSFQQTEDLNQQFSLKPAPKPTGRAEKLGNSPSIDTEVIRPVGVKGSRKVYTQQLQAPTNENSVVTIEDQIQQASGTKWHNEHQPGDLTSDSYQQRSGVDFTQTTGIKPSVTLEPLDGNDSWDIREKTDEVNQGVANPSVQAEYPTEEVTTSKPGFWNQVSKKFTNTIKKAKDKVTDVFS